MNRLRSLGSLLLAMLAGGAVLGVCYWMASCTRIALARDPANDLAWLGREFHLTAEDLARIRPLHEAYLPDCTATCARIEAKNRELAEGLKGATNVSPAMEAKLAEVALLHAECQARMLRHFQEVARAMPRDQGARYLAEMQRLTLGLRHSSGDLMEHP